MLTQLTYAQIGERLSIGSEDFCTGIDLSHFQLTFADEFDSFDWSPDGSIGWRTTLDWGNRTLPPNNEAQYYSDASVGVDPFYLHDGVLDITATAGSNPLGLPYSQPRARSLNSMVILRCGHSCQLARAYGPPSGSCPPITPGRLSSTCLKCWVAIRRPRSWVSTAWPLESTLQLARPLQLPIFPRASTPSE